jgi:antirestriction protein ArdC
MAKPASLSPRGRARKQAVILAYVVFNVEQIGGLDMSNIPCPGSIKNRDQQDGDLDAAFAPLARALRRGRIERLFSPAADHIQMPPLLTLKAASAF